MNRLQIILSNPHTTWVGVIAAGCYVGQIWLPQYKEQFHRTMEAALIYGTIMAGDGRAKPEPSKDGTPNQTR